MSQFFGKGTTPVVRPYNFPVANSIQTLDPKTPLIKKRSGRKFKFKNAHILKRLQQERRRQNGNVIPMPGTFQTRFESKPVKFKMSKSVPFTTFQSPRKPKKSIHPFFSPKKRIRAQVSPTPTSGPEPPPSAMKSPPSCEGDAPESLAKVVNKTKVEKATTAATPIATRFVEHALHDVSLASSEQRAKANKMQNEIPPVAAAAAAVATKFVKRTVREVSTLESNCDSEYEDDDDTDVASLLCLVPFIFQFPNEEMGSTYWPCLVFSGIRQAIVYHKRLYPHQEKIQKRLVKRVLRVPQDSVVGESDENRSVVLPLGDKDECCPKEICVRPIYDSIDTTPNSSDGFWKTLTKKKGKCIEAGKRVVRLTENLNVVGPYVKEMKNQIPAMENNGDALEKALIEMERLIYLDDNKDGDDGCDKENYGTPFVSSYKSISKDGDEKDSPIKTIRFLVNIPQIEKPRRSRSRGSNKTSFVAKYTKSTEKAIQFPNSSEKSRKRPSPSISPEATSDTSFRATKMTTRATRVEPNTVEKEKAPETSIMAIKKIATRRTRAKPNFIEKEVGKSKNNENGSRRRNHAKLSKTAAGKPPPIQCSKKVCTALAKKKKPTVIDSNAKIEVSSWGAIKQLMIQLGHTFYQEEQTKGRVVEIFCRPNGDPRRNKDASEDDDYFTSLTAYRAHLCAHGVEYIVTNMESDHGSGNDSPLEDEDLELIAYWVRFHVFSHRVIGTGRHSEKVLDLELSGNKGKYIKLLQRIGYKYACSNLQEGYVVPKEKPRRFLTETELFQHLGKYGLSKDCDSDEFESAEETMALDIQIIRRYHGNYGDKAFRRILKLDFDTNKDDPGNNSEIKECTPAANKGALEACTRGPDSDDERDGQGAVSPRKLMRDETEPETETTEPRPPSPPAFGATNKESTKEGDGMVSSSGPLPTSELNSLLDPASSFNRISDSIIEGRRFDNLHQSSEATIEAKVAPKQPASSTEEAAVAEVEVLGTTKMEGDRQVAVSHKHRSCGTTVEAKVTPKQPASSSEEAAITEADLPGTTNKEKLDSCLVNLRNNEIVAHGQLSNSIARIQSFVEAVIESSGRNSDVQGSNKMPILYICGNPGTGKTMSTKRICEAAITEKLESKEEWEKAPKLCHISCPSLQNFKYQDGMKKIMERMGVKQNQLKRSQNDDMNAATILVLDEVDQLLGSKGTKSILKQLSSWAMDEAYTLSIIGISNAVYNGKTQSLMEYGMGGLSNKLVFKTYLKSDLVKISQAKIGFTVIAKNAHEFIAAKVSNSSGDARQYLDLVEKAVIFCKRKLSLEKLDSDHSKPIVAIRDAMKAISETNHKSRDIIRSLTSTEKMTLCAGVHLARKLGGKPVELGKLRTLTMMAYGLDSDLSLEDFKGVIERLQDNGLLKLNEKEKQAFTKTSMCSLLRYPVHFDLQLEDVDSALEDTLMKEEFYKNMVERLRNAAV